MSMIGDFEITCTICGSDKVAIVYYHNDWEEGQRIKCTECGAKADL